MYGTSNSPKKPDASIRGVLKEPVTIPLPLEELVIAILASVGLLDITSIQNNKPTIQICRYAPGVVGA